MATGGERIDPKSNVAPYGKYNLASVGRGTSSIVEKSIGGMHALQDKGISGGPQEQYKMKAAGTSRFDVTDRSLSSGRKM